MARRTANGSGTIRQRPDGTYEARYSIGANPKTGKYMQKSIYGKTKQEVARKLRAITNAIDENRYLEPSKMTLKQWLEKWLDEYNGNVRENTLVSYRTQVNTNIVPYLGAVKLSDLNGLMIQSAINKLFRRKEKPLCAKSVKNCYGVLHKSLSKALTLGLIAKNPCDAVELPKVVKKEIQPLDEAEIRLFLSAIKGHINEYVFKIALFTGLRQAELMGLQWEDIDFANGTIFVHQQLIHEKKKGGMYKLAITKTGSSVRKIHPGMMVMEWLKERKLQQQEQKKAAANFWHEEIPGLVFTTEFGKNLSNVTLTHQATKFGEAIGKNGFRFHDLRHSYAVASIMAGDDMKTISSNLGHATISITMDVYANFTEDMAKASADRMTAYMKKFDSDNI